MLRGVSVGPDFTGCDTVGLRRSFLARDASLIERMEQDGVVSRPKHKGLREVLLADHGEE